jgi:hypothetical protein
MADNSHICTIFQHVVLLRFPFVWAIKGAQFSIDADIHLVVYCWVSGLSPDFYFNGMDIIISQWNKYFNRHGDYVEK